MWRLSWWWILWIWYVQEIHLWQWMVLIYSSIKHLMLFMCETRLSRKKGVYYSSPCFLTCFLTHKKSLQFHLTFTIRSDVISYYTTCLRMQKPVCTVCGKFPKCFTLVWERFMNDVLTEASGLFILETSHTALIKSKLVVAPQNYWVLNKLSL